MPERCAWAESSPLLQDYHDHEWGVPVRDDQRLFEFLILEGAQAGLSWETILRKRATYRAAFAGFDPAVVARYDAERIETLMANPGIVRNRRKIEAAIQNAHAFLAVQAEHGTFSTYIWGFVGGAPIQRAWPTRAEVPTTSAESDALSRDLKRRGFAFVGSTICYAFMQATGMVNDHVTTCYRWAELGGGQDEHSPTPQRPSLP